MVPWSWHPDAPKESLVLEVPVMPVWFQSVDEKVSTTFEKLPGQRRHVGYAGGGFFYSSGKAACLRLVRGGGKATEKAPTKLTNLVDICGFGELVAISDFQGQLGVGNFGMSRGSRQPDIVLKHPDNNTASPTSPSTLPPPLTSPYFTHLEWLSKTHLIALCSNSTILELDVSALSTRASKSDEPLDLSEGVFTIRESTHPQPPDWTSHMTPNRGSGSVSAISQNQQSVETYTKRNGVWKLAYNFKAHDGAKIHAIHTATVNNTDYLVTVSTDLNMRIWDIEGSKPRLVYCVTLFKDDKMVDKETTKLCGFMGGRFTLYWEEAIQLVFDLTMCDKGTGLPKLEGWRQDVGNRLELGSLNSPSSFCILFADRLGVAHFNCNASNAIVFHSEPYKSCFPDSPNAAPLPPPSFIREGAEESKLGKVMERLRMSLASLTGPCNDMNAVSQRISDLTVRIHGLNIEPKQRTQAKYEQLLLGCESEVDRLDKGSGQSGEIVDIVGKSVKEIGEGVGKEKEKLHEAILNASWDVKSEVKKFKDDVYLGMISPELQGLKHGRKQKARGLVRSEFKSLQEIEITSLEALSDSSTELLSDHIKAAQQLGSALSEVFSVTSREAAAHASFPTPLPPVSQSISQPIDDLPSILTKLNEQYAQAALKREQQTMQILDEHYREMAESMPREDSVMPDDSISMAAWNPEPSKGHRTAWTKLIDAGKYNECIYEINTKDMTGLYEDMSWFRSMVADKKELVFSRISIEAAIMLLRSSAIDLDARPRDTASLDWLIFLGKAFDLSSVLDRIDRGVIRQVRYAEEIGEQILLSTTLEKSKRNDLEIAVQNLRDNADMLEF